MYTEIETHNRFFFEDTKVVIRNDKSKKNRQFNGKK